MSTSANVGYRRLAIAIVGLLTALLTITWHAGSASAAASAYPPPPPATCSSSPAASSTGGASTGKNCGVDSITVHKTPHTTTHHSSDLASTGFQTATALAIVVAFLAVGGLCLYAGSRRRQN